ncbi:hypothetical protein Tcan_05936 [Toxocara canis]|uniref:Uncharacterized protein n=1 Tax=Toxocara canis TaxID=6265 RepID=A0A0B2VK36_TOXCA|nr:hypothetical protein Tcan_05936 [Toxocara canis]
MVEEHTAKYLKEHRLQASRIQNLKMCTVPSQRRIYPIKMDTLRTRSYDVLLAFFTLFAVRIMIDMPACIPLYWLVVSASGIVQSLMLRHPRVKALLGIQRLPTDSHRPFRDLFFLRRDKFI